MDNAVIVQGILIIWGVISLIMSFKNFAWNRMVVPIEFWWCMLTLMIIVLAFFRRLFSWCNDLNTVLVIALLAAFLIALHTIFHLCRIVSMLVNRNQELCMQISLLNEENEQYLINSGIVPDRYEEDTYEEKDTVCN